MASRAILLATALVAGCASGGGRDGKTNGDIMVTGGGDPVSTAVGLTEMAVSAPLALINATIDWKRTDEQAPLPWIAPDKRVEAYAKGKIPTPMDMDMEKYRWRVGEDMIYPYYKYNDRVSEFVLSDPISGNWEFSGESMSRRGWFFSKPIVMPDYDFYLVSIEPMVVIMVPTGIHRRARHEPITRAKLSDRAILPVASIKYSTRFRAPRGQMLMWFSPDLGIPVRLVSFSYSGQLALEAGNFRLACTRTGDDAECTRPKIQH